MQGHIERREREREREREGERERECVGEGEKKRVLSLSPSPPIKFHRSTGGGYFIGGGEEVILNL